MAVPDPKDETELRRGTVLFVDITGFTALTEKLDLEEAYFPVQECIGLLDEIATDHGGKVDHYLGDAIMAVFGVPIAMEEAPKAALNAAIEMHNRVREFSLAQGLPVPIDVHTGINTGKLISGDVIHRVRRDFAVMGDAVNIAARLKDLAPNGEIWVGPETYAATRDDFEFRPLPPIPLKGKLESVQIYELVSRRKRLHRPRVGLREAVHSPLVGRADELGKLHALLARVRGGEGGVATLLGEVGSGKSRLLSELAASEQASGMQWLEGRSVSVGSQISYHPFVDLLRAWVGSGDDDDDDTTLAALEAAVERLLGDEASEVTPFLANLVGLLKRPEHRQRVAGIEGEAMEKLLLRSVGAVLGRLAEETPLVLVFEDVHWADTSSLELLEALLRLTGRHPILFLLVARPDLPEPAQRLRDAIRAQYAERHVEVDLERLDRSGSEELIENLFAGGDVPHTTRALIDERTEGNPFFIEAVVWSLIDQGAVTWRDAALFATEKIANIDVPGSVQEVITARVDRLEPARKQVLQLVSVVGRSCDLRILRAVADAADLQTQDLEAALRGLEAAQLLVRRERRADPEVEFKHPLIQEVTYGMILRTRRRTLHQAVGEAMETLIPDGTPALAARLAYHFSLGADPRAAEEYLFRAGDEAARVAASSEALHFFREASERYLQTHGENADPRKRALLEKKIGLASFHRGRDLDAAEHFAHALALLGEREPASRIAATRRFLGALASVLADLYVRRRARARPEATAEQREVLDLLLLRAQVQTTAAPTRFVIDCMYGLDRLRAVDPATIERPGAFYAGPVGVFSYSGLSFRLANRFLEMARSFANPDDIQESAFVRGIGFTHALLSGDWGAEHDLPPDFVSEALRYGRLWDVTVYLGLAGDKRVFQGRFREAREHIEELSKIEELYDYALARSNRQYVRTLLALERRELEPALGFARKYIAEHDEPAIQILGQAARAEIHLLRGEFAPAREALEAAARVLDESGIMPPFQMGSYLRTKLELDVAELEAAKRAGERRAARRHARAARRSARWAKLCARRVAWELPRTHRLVGTRLWLKGRRRRALRWWSSAREHAERLEMRPELARLYLEIGRRLEARGGRDRFDGQTGPECLRRAEALFGELGLAVEPDPDAR